MEVAGIPKLNSDIPCSTCKCLTCTGGPIGEALCKANNSCVLHMDKAANCMVIKTTCPHYESIYPIM